MVFAHFLHHCHRERGPASSLCETPQRGSLYVLILMFAVVIGSNNSFCSFIGLFIVKF